MSIKKNEEIDPTKSALAHLTDLMIESEKANYKSLDEACVEIIRLRQEIYFLKLRVPLKRPKGRPKKYRAEKIPKLGGRPVTTSIEEAQEIVRCIDDIRKTHFWPKGKAATDRKIIDRWVEKDPASCNLKRDDKKAHVDQLCKELKYLRDKTGIRQRQKKQKTSPKNP